MTADESNGAGGVPDRTSTLVAALAVRARPQGFEVDAVLDVVRRAVEGVAQRAMGIEVTWSTSAVLQSDDLESGTAQTRAPGLDWQFARRRLDSGRPHGVSITGVSTVMREAFQQDPDMDRYNPRMYVVDVDAQFPLDWAVPPNDGLTVRVAMSRWAMYGGGERLDWIAPALSAWMVDAGTALGADSGYVLADAPSLSSDDSDWQQENGLRVGRRDPGEWLHAYGWGTLLGPGHLEAVGGMARVRETGSLVHELPGGRAWVQLGDDPATVLTDTLDRLRSVLSAVLPLPRPGP